MQTEPEFIPNEGLRYQYNKISLIATAFWAAKPGQKLDAKVATAMMELNMNWNRDEKDFIKFSNADVFFTESDFEDFNDEFCYKYIPRQFLEDIKNGNFRLGILDSYIKTENRKIMDVTEGYTVLKINGKIQEIYTSIIGGFHNYIFCMSTEIEDGDKPNTQMQKQFGDVVIKIKIKEFAETIAREIGAISYRIKSIKYGNTKLYCVNAPELELHPGNLNFSQMTRFHDPIINCGYLPCLFMKPSGFKPEQEVRITFEMDHDLRAPLVVQCSNVLKFVTVLNN